MTYVQLPSANADAACRSWSRQTNEMLRSNVADEQRRTNLKRGHIMSNVICKRMFVQRAKGSWTSWCIFSVILFGNVWVLLHVYIVLVHCTSFFPSVLMIIYRAASPSFFFSRIQRYSHGWVAKKNISHGNEVILQGTTHLIQRPRYQRGSLCQDPAVCRTTRRPPDHRKEMQTAVVRTCLPLIRSGQNHIARHSERGKTTSQTEEEVGKHQGMDRPGVLQFP